MTNKLIKILGYILASPMILLFVLVSIFFMLLFSPIFVIGIGITLIEKESIIDYAKNYMEVCSI